MKNKKLFAILTLVCFMFTLMPVAAFAAPFDEQKSYVGVKQSKVEVGDKVTVEFDMNEDATTDALYVWFEEVGYDDVIVKDVALAVGETAAMAEVAANTGLFVATGTIDQYEDLTVVFGRDGEFVVKAAVVDPRTEVEGKTFNAKNELRALANTTVVVEPTDEDSDEYELEIISSSEPLNETKTPGYIENNEVAEMTVAVANGAYVDSVELKLIDKFDEAVSSLDVEIDTTSGVEVSNVKLHRSGKVAFDVSATRAGTHKVTITVGDYTGVIKVIAQDRVADEIVVATSPKTPINLATLQRAGSNLVSYLTFNVLDANGAMIAGGTNGIVGATSSSDGTTTNPYRNYVALTEKPADSDLTSADFELVYVSDYESGTLCRTP